MMKGKVIVDSVWEDSEAIVEEENEEEDDQGQSTELDTCADLETVRMLVVMGSGNSSQFFGSSSFT